MQLNEFRPAADIPDKFVGTLTAQRSDGQWFYVFLVFSKGDIVSAPDPVVLVQEKLRQGRAKLDTFRDCSCGIIGYRKTGEVDDEGDPIEEAVHSPCATHHKGVRI